MNMPYSQAERRRRGFTFLEIMASLLFLSGAIITVLAMMSRDFNILTNNRIDLIGQTAVRQRMEFRRLQPFGTFTAELPATSIASFCRDFHNDAGYENLKALPSGQGQECAEYFDVNRRRYTVIAKVFDRPTSDTDPNLHQWRAVTVITNEGLNRP